MVRDGSGASVFSQTLVCHPGLGIKTVAELLRLAKTRPVSCTWGSAGSPGHLTTELFRGIAGFEMTHVPYKGPALAVSGTGRSSLLPDVPTVAEAGYPGFDSSFSLVL